MRRRLLLILAAIAAALVTWRLTRSEDPIPLSTEPGDPREGDAED